MKRVTVVVEGQTEESFVKDVLAEALWRRGVYLTPILLGVPGHKGGRPNYARLRKDVILHLEQDRTAYCSTMLDLHGLGAGFPGTQKTAWFMDHRIRLGFSGSELGKLSGHVEADETFIGGKARNMHPGKRARRITGTGGKDKTAVMGILERGKDNTSKVRTAVVPNRKKNALQAEVRKHVEVGSALYTDALKSYEGLNEFEHQVIDHAVAYVDGKVHTNGLENFWSLLKRGLKGTYVSVEPFHLFRYLDEQAFRFNERKLRTGNASA